MELGTCQITLCPEVKPETFGEQCWWLQFLLLPCWNSVVCTKSYGSKTLSATYISSLIFIMSPHSMSKFPLFLQPVVALYAFLIFHILLVMSCIFFFPSSPSWSQNHSFFKKFIYFWLHWVFVAALRLSLVAVSWGYSSLRCTGFSLRWLLLLRSTGSRCAGLSSCGMQAQ